MGKPPLVDTHSGVDYGLDGSARRWVTDGHGRAFRTREPPPEITRPELGTWLNSPAAYGRAMHRVSGSPPAKTEPTPRQRRPPQVSPELTEALRCVDAPPWAIPDALKELRKAWPVYQAACREAKAKNPRRVPPWECPSYRKPWECPSYRKRSPASKNARTRGSYWWEEADGGPWAEAAAARTRLASFWPVTSMALSRRPAEHSRITKATLRHAAAWAAYHRTPDADTLAEREVPPVLVRLRAAWAAYHEELQAFPDREALEHKAFPELVAARAEYRRHLRDAWRPRAQRESVPDPLTKREAVRLEYLAAMLAARPDVPFLGPVPFEHEHDPHLAVARTLNRAAAVDMAAELWGGDAEAIGAELRRRDAERPAPEPDTSLAGVTAVDLWRYEAELEGLARLEHCQRDTNGRGLTPPLNGPAERQAVAMARLYARRQFTETTAPHRCESAT